MRERREKERERERERERIGTLGEASIVDNLGELKASQRSNLARLHSKKIAQVNIIMRERERERERDVP